MIRTTLYQVGKEWVVGALKKSDILAAEAKEVVSRTAQASKPKITFGQPIKPKIQATEVKQVSHNADGLNILAEQNRAFVVNGKKSSFSFGTLQGTTQLQALTKRINPIGKTPQKLIDDIAKVFQDTTGIKLHCPTNANLSEFGDTINEVEQLFLKGLMPKDIKHLVIGHGGGSSINGSWNFIYSGSKNDKVFSYINSNIPKGELALVATCEENFIPALRSEALASGYNAIGDTCITSLIETTHPGKIVESGKNVIIGSLSRQPHSVDTLRVEYYKDIDNWYETMRAKFFNK